MKKEQKSCAPPAARIVSRKQVFERYFSVEVVEAEPRSLKHDGYLPKIEREVMFIGNVAAVLPYCPETDEILLNQQFRMGAFLADDPDPFLFECAAGGIDDGETPEAAAKRETLEETGCAVLDLAPVGRFYSSPGVLDEVFHLFVGRIAQPKAGHHGLADEGEEIKTHLLPAAKVLEMLDAGAIGNATTAAVIGWFARHHEKLKKKWLI
jgi:ADP-ribose pyrophosphatase